MTQKWAQSFSQFLLKLRGRFKARPRKLSAALPPSLPAGPSSLSGVVVPPPLPQSPSPEEKTPPSRIPPIQIEEPSLVIQTVPVVPTAGPTLAPWMRSSTTAEIAIHEKSGEAPPAVPPSTASSSTVLPFAVLPSAAATSTASPSEAEPLASPLTTSDSSPSEDSGPQRGLAVVLAGSLRGWEEWRDQADEREVIELQGIWLQLMEARVTREGGQFEAISGNGPGVGFAAQWGLGALDPRQPETLSRVIQRARQCLCFLNQDLALLNSSRNVDGLPPIQASLVLHCGSLISGRVSLSGAEVREVWFGDGLEGALTLLSLGRTSHWDLLLSQEVWSGDETQAAPVKAVVPLGDHRLTPESLLIGVFGVTQYQLSADQVVDCPAGADLNLRAVIGAPGSGPLPLSRDCAESEAGVRPSEVAKSHRWMVNNGSQIIGPLSPAELAKLIFTQELDFDSEVWSEGTGDPQPLKESGVFSGSGDEGASHWVYDGEVLHGPLSLGFIRTAVRHGAFQPEHQVCEGSTLKGWQPVSAVLEKKDSAPSAA
jgi:class 3 adenylate cyclase